MLLPLSGLQNLWFWFRIHLQVQTLLMLDVIRIKHQNRIPIYACFLDGSFDGF